jgi:hypothetical protein
VTKKNRKVRRLRELYPDVRIRVLYQRDYLSLLAKYGLEPPSQMAPPTPIEGGPALVRAAPGGTAASARPAMGAVKGPARGGVREPVEPRGAGERMRERPGGSVERAGGAVERATAAGRPRVVPDPPKPVPPLPADPELVRLAQVLLPAEIAQRRGPAAARQAG